MDESYQEAMDRTAREHAERLRERLRVTDTETKRMIDRFLLIAIGQLTSSGVCLRLAQQTLMDLGEGFELGDDPIEQMVAEVHAYIDALKVAVELVEEEM